MSIRYFLSLRQQYRDSFALISGYQYLGGVVVRDFNELQALLFI